MIIHHQNQTESFLKSSSNFFSKTSKLILIFSFGLFVRDKNVVIVTPTRDQKRRLFFFSQNTQKHQQQEQLIQQTNTSDGIIEPNRHFRHQKSHTNPENGPTMTPQGTPRAPQIHPKSTKRQPWAQDGGKLLR